MFGEKGREGRRREGEEVLRREGRAKQGPGREVAPGTTPQRGEGLASTYPTWWMCMPLLVGLAGADWVREEVSRIRWGRAFTVA